MTTQQTRRCFVILSIAASQAISTLGLDVHLDTITGKVALEATCATGKLGVLSQETALSLCNTLRTYGRPETVSNGVVSLLEMVGHDLLASSMLIEGRGREGGTLPTWDEIVSCATVSSNPVLNLFLKTNLATNDSKVTRLFATCGTNAVVLRRNSETQMYPLNRKGGEAYLLRFNPVNSVCMCYMRFGMRLFDAKGKWIWQDLDEVYGECKVCITDVSGDDEPDILLYRESHDGIACILWTLDTTKLPKEVQEEHQRVRNSQQGCDRPDKQTDKVSLTVTGCTSCAGRGVSPTNSE